MHEEHITALKQSPKWLDYSLTGINAQKAIEKGLAEADWYTCRVPRKSMRKLLERKNGPAIRDTLIWFTLIIGSAYAAFLLWGSWWAIIPLFIYATLYASTSDSRWHESSHGTAFKTDWMNNFLYEIASFMIMRESVVWRWSHTRHHSDTIIVGRDPEIAAPRPPDLKKLTLAFFGLTNYPNYFKHIVLHTFGKMTDDEKAFIPESEFSKVFFRARIYLLIYLNVIGLTVYMQSVFPLLLIGLPHIYGSWLMMVYGLTQHAGLAENVLDHRLNCRTVYMNPIHRFLYWNMNYHVEHHMFPLVPYHALPRLHEAVKEDCPTAYPNLIAAWKEIIPALLKQVRDPAYYVKRKLPPPQKSTSAETSGKYSEALPDKSGWLEVCTSTDIDCEDVIRFDYRRKTYALSRDGSGRLYATDGICTHGNTHLADGLVKGGIIECPKHNGRFNLKDGSPSRAPVCRGLATYPIEERKGRIWLNVEKPGGEGAREHKTYSLRVVSNRSVSTFIKELVLEPVGSQEILNFMPGDYIQLDIPQYEEIAFGDFDIPEPYASVWKQHHLFDLRASNHSGNRRNNYSIASNSKLESALRFNVRIATPPTGQDCPPGIGSSYVFSLKKGDIVNAIGPFGDFHIKPTQKEIIYIGGGAGMAPIRAHISKLLESDVSARKISYWYGARSRQEIFYEDYFERLTNEYPNFNFQIALSAALESDNWQGLTGFIHEVVYKEYLKHHERLNAVEFYLCGPPMMIKACNKMLAELKVSAEQISFDEF